MKKQPEITEATRKAIIDAFCTFYKDKPIEKITIQEITNKAGFNRSTFYQYFKDVYDLLTYLEDIVISHVCENINANIVRGNISDTFITSFTNIREEMEIYIEALMININSTKFSERLKTVLLPVLMEKFYISETDIKSIYLLDFYLSGLISIAKRWLQNGQNTSVEELGALLHSRLMKGFLTILGQDHLCEVEEQRE